MDIIVKNINDLDAEIARLSDLKGGQETALALRFSSPGAIFSTVLTLFPKSPAVEGIKSTFFNQDIVGVLSRILLPLALNKTLFRKSNFIVKALVGLVSQKASHFINEDNVIGVWNKIKSTGILDKITGLFNKKAKKEPAYPTRPPGQEA